MNFKASKLSNGISVVTYNMPSFKTVAINLIAKVGSRFEEDNEHGISHFIEHMAFKGTKTRTSKQIAEEFDSIGGHFNAYTSKEQTVYHTKVLSENTKDALEIIADIIQNSVFNHDDINNEYNVICQEIAQVHDNPDDLCYENLIASCFKDQPLGKSILGTELSIKNFNTNNFIDYTNKHYYGENLILAAAGNVEHDQLVMLAEELFCNLRASGAKTIIKTSHYTQGITTLEKDLEHSLVFLSFNSGSYQNLNEFYHTQMLSLILGGGLSSRLFQNIREDKGLAYSVGSFNNVFSDNGLFSLYAGTAHEKVNEVIINMFDEVNSITNNITEIELNRTKSQIKTSILMADEKTGFKAEEIGKNYALFNRFIPIEEVISCVESATTHDLTAIAAKVFSTPVSASIIGSNIKNINIDTVKEFSLS